jgi:hypothetical protein
MTAGASRSRRPSHPPRSARSVFGIDLYWPYLAPLIVVFCMTIMTGIGPMQRTAIALALNWLVNTAFVLSTKIYDPWLFYIIIDSISAWIILYQPAGRIQSVIGWTLIAQVVMHSVYGISKFLHPDISATRYWQVLTIIGFVQLMILGGWAGGYWCRVGYRWIRSRYPRSVGARSPKGLA